MEKKLKSFITEERYIHSRGVREAAVKLAHQYGCNREKAGIAGLLHDVARDLPIERLERIVEEDDISGNYNKTGCINPILLHAPAGSIIAKKYFDINDEEILRSIELHTTGGVSMSLLDKVVFVADFIEPGRNFRGVKTARILAHRDINAAILFILKSLLQGLLQTEKPICEKTFYAYNEFVLKGMRKINGD